MSTKQTEALKLALEALEYERGANNPLDWHHEKIITAIREALAEQPVQQQSAERGEPVAGKGKEFSDQLKLCARNVAFAASGHVDMSLAAMQEMFALIDHVCVGLDSPPAQQQEPIYQMQMMDGKWIDQAKHRYEYLKARGHTVRIVYTSPQPAQQESEAVRAAWMAGYTEGEREAIEKAQQQEPVAWANKVIGGKKWLSIHASKGASDKWLEYRRKEQAWSEQYEQIALYTSPPASKPLTDEQIDAIWDAVITPSNHIREFVRAIEAAHGIKG